MGVDPPPESPPLATATPAPTIPAPPTASVAATPAPRPAAPPAKPAGRAGKTATVALLEDWRHGQLRVAVRRARHHQGLSFRRAALGEGPVERVHVVLDPAPNELLLRAREDAGVAGSVGRHLDVVPVGGRVGDAEVHPRPGEAGPGSEAGVEPRVRAGDDASNALVVDGDALRPDRRRREDADEAQHKRSLPHVSFPCRSVGETATDPRSLSRPASARRV